MTEPITDKQLGYMNALLSEHLGESDGPIACKNYRCAIIEVHKRIRSAWARVDHQTKVCE